MSDETRDATVRLSADVDPYRREIAAAAEDTNKLATAVDRLSQKLDGISKRAGKKLMLFGAGGAAGIAGITAEAAQFEKQLSVLNATAAVTDKTMSGFKKNISDLTKQFPVSRGEAVELIKTLDKLGIQSHKSMENISKAMVRLSSATGEDMLGLTTSMVELGRQMGTINSGTMDQFANSLLVLSKNAGVSATQVVNFAQAIAPAARAAGMSEQAVLGVSTAFTKAGQDGFAAATTFNTMLSDITRLVSSGSPEIAKYSNLIGTTVDNFKQMDAASQLAAIFESINKQGPNAIRTLDRLGYDGVRIQRAIQGTSQSGGLQAAINDAVTSYSGNTGALKSASDASMQGLADELERTATAFEHLAATAGEPFLKMFKPVVEIFNDMLNLARPLTSAFAGLGGAIAGVMTAGGLALGGAMFMGSKNFALAAGRTALGPGVSLLGGVQAGRAAAGGTLPREGSMGYRALDQYTSGRMRWWHLPGFMLGHGLGQWMGPGDPTGPSAWRQYGGPAMSSPFRLARTIFNAQSDFYREARVPTYERNAPVMGTMGNMARAMRHPADFWRGFTSGGTVIPKGAGAMRDPEEFGRAMAAGSKAAVARAAADRTNIAVSRQLATSVGLASGALMKMYAQAMVTTTTTLAKGAWMAGKGIVGGMAGMLFGHPLLAGAAAIGGGAYLADKIHDQNRRTMTQDLEQLPIARYNAALGIATDETVGFARAVKSATDNLPKLQDLEDAKTISEAVKKLAFTPGRELTNPGMLPYGRGGGSAGLTNYLHMLGITDPSQLQLAQTDMSQAFGVTRSQKAVDQFFVDREKERGINFNALANQTTSMQGQRTTDWWKGGIFGTFGPSDTASRMMAESTESLSRRYDRDNKFYGEQYAGTRMLQGYGEFIGAMLPSKKEVEAANNDRTLLNAFGFATPGSQAGRLGLSRSKAGRNATAAVARLEKDLFNGGDLDFGMKDVVQMIEQLGKKANDPDARMKWFMNNVVATSDNKKVQRTLAQWAEQGITPANMDEETMNRLKFTSESDYTRRIKAIGPVGRGALKDQTILDALSKPGDINAQYQGVQQLLDKVNGVSGGFAETDAILQKFKSQAQSSTDELYKLAAAAQQLNAVQRQSAMYYMDRGTRTAEVVGGFRQALAGDPKADDYKERVEARKAEVLADKQANYDYLKGIVEALRDFKIQTERMEEDRQRTIARSNRDFGIAMEHAEQDYYTSRLRSQRDFGIQMAHAQEDFNTSMQRSQEDFARGMKRQAEDAAKGMYDPFKRVPVEFTAGLGTTLRNMTDQNERLAAQAKNVAKLKKEGLSQEAIDTLQLMDPAKMRQVERMARDAEGNEEYLEQISKQAARRQRVAKNLVQNPLNEEYRRTIADHKREVDRATNDFEKAQGRAVAANDRMLADMAENYERMVKRATKAHNLGLKDMEKEAAIQLKRSKENMLLMGEEIFGDFNTIMTRAMTAIEENLGELASGWIEKLIQFKKDNPEYFVNEKDLGRPKGQSKSPRAEEERGRRDRDGGGSGLNRGLPRVHLPDLSPRLGFSRSEVKDGRTVPSKPVYKGGGTSYDYSTNFNGDFQVVANDPNKLLKELAEKARVKRLTRPSIAPPD